MGLWRLRSPRSAIYKLEPQESQWCRSSANPRRPENHGSQWCKPQSGSEVPRAGEDGCPSLSREQIGPCSTFLFYSGP